MKKKYTKLLMLIAMLLTCTITLAQTTVTFTFKTDEDITYVSTGTSGGGGKCEVQKSNVTLVGTNAYTDAAKTLNVYKESELEITAPGNIVSVTVEYNEKVYPFDEAVGDGTKGSKFSTSGAHQATYTPATPATSVTLTNPNGGKTELLSIAVTYTKGAVVSVSGVSLDVTSKTLILGETLTLTPTISPANATNKSVKWTSSDETVAKVNSGTVTTVKPGSATITVETVDGKYKATCSVTVERKPAPPGATFYESFDLLPGVGGNDNKWSFSDAPVLGEFDNNGWTTEGSLYSGAQCVSIRKNSDTTKPSGVTTPAIGEEGNAVVSFMAEAWGNDGSNFFVDIVGDGTFAVSEGLEEGNISNEGKTAKVIMAKTGAWTTYSLNVEGITADTKFRFYAPANKRAFLDEVVIYVSPAPEPKTYSLVGWINGADYGCESDWENPGEYIFDEDGKLTVKFDQDSYVFVKTTDNSNWYLTEAYVPAGEAGAQVTATMVNGKNYGEKMQVPGGYDIELTLTEKEDNTIELTYTMPTPPTEMVLVESELNDKIIEGGLIWNGLDADGNHVYVAVDAEGKLSTGYTEMILKGQPLYRATDGTATITTNEDGSKTLDATVTFNEIGTYHITGTYAPTEMVLSNNEIKESPSSSAITWEGRDADGNYVSVAVDAEGKLSVGSTAIFTYDFSAMYEATDGTATITTNEDGSKSLDATITFEEIGTYHITGTIAAPAPCPFDLPTVTATTEDITFVFDLTDAVEGKDNPELEATIVVKKGEMEYTAGLSEEDVVDGKVIKTISNAIFSAGFSSLTLEAGDEIEVTIPEATIWEKVDGSWNKAWTGEVEGSVTATVPVPTEKPLTNCGIDDFTSMGGPVIFVGKDSDNNNVAVAINPDGTLDMDITAIMLADLSANITAESGTGTITTNADGSKSLDATVKFKDGNTYHITGTVAAPAPCPFGLPTITATTEEIVITFDLADAVEGVENPTLEPSAIVINDQYYASGFGEIDVVDGKVELKISVAKFLSAESLELSEGQEITVTIPEVALYENYTAGGYRTLYEGAMEGSVQATVTAASGIKTLSSASDDAVKYNLAGQRVKNAKGIIIVNGKKVAVK